MLNIFYGYLTIFCPNVQITLKQNFVMKRVGRVIIYTKIFGPVNRKLMMDKQE